MGKLMGKQLWLMGVDRPLEISISVVIYRNVSGLSRCMRYASRLQKSDLVAKLPLSALLRNRDPVKWNTLQDLRWDRRTAKLAKSPWPVIHSERRSYFFIWVVESPEYLRARLRARD